MGAIAPGALDDVRVEVEALHHVRPEVAELAVAEGDHLVARRQRVGQRGLPAARASACRCTQTCEKDDVANEPGQHGSV